MFGQSQQINSDLSGLVGGQLPSGAGKSLQLDNSGNLLTSATVTPAANQRVNAQAGDFVVGSIVDLATYLTLSGTPADANTVNSFMGRFTKIRDLLAATLTVQGTVTANAGTNLNTSALALEAGHLATIDSHIPAQGQAAMAASTPVAIASNQSAVPVSGTVTTTPPANASTNVTQIGGAALAEGQATMANSIPVVIASNQSNLPENLAQVGGTNIALGQTTMSASIPVTLASNQSAQTIQVASTKIDTETQTGISASGNSADLTVTQYRELLALCNLSALTGTSVQFKIQGKDSSGNYYSLATGTALVAPGTTILSLGSGMTTNTAFPQLVRIQWVLVAVTTATFTVDLWGK